MKLLMIELHGMDISLIENMAFIKQLKRPKEFDTYIGLAATEALWTGLGELQSGCYHRHMWNGTSSFWDNKLFRLLRGDLYFCKNDQREFRLSRTKNFYQDCAIFKELDYCYSDRPVIATNTSIHIDLARDEVVRVKHMQKYWTKTLNYIRLRKIDLLGHRYGPYSSEVNDYIRVLDHALEEVYERFDGQVICFSTYGMMEPNRKIDVWSDLTELRNLVFFIDDGNVRIWDNGFKSSVKQALSYLEGLNCGYWLKDRPERKFGDYFYRANRGIAFVPNNYVKYDIKGIHYPKGWMVSNCGEIDHITEFKDLILKVCKNNHRLKF